MTELLESSPFKKSRRMELWESSSTFELSQVGDGVVMAEEADSGSMTRSLAGLWKYLSIVAVILAVVTFALPVNVP